MSSTYTYFLRDVRAEDFDGEPPDARTAANVAAAHRWARGKEPLGSVWLEEQTQTLPELVTTLAAALRQATLKAQPEAPAATTPKPAAAAAVPSPATSAPAAAAPAQAPAPKPAQAAATPKLTGYLRLREAVERSISKEGAR